MKEIIIKLALCFSIIFHLFIVSHTYGQTTIVLYVRGSVFVQKDKQTWQQVKAGIYLDYNHIIRLSPDACLLLVKLPVNKDDKYLAREICECEKRRGIYIVRDIFAE
ncbi:MAG: hypothetical protein QXF12_00415 [Candidatus Aenigmatarchaeota archaeon]